MALGNTCSGQDLINEVNSKAEKKAILSDSGDLMADKIVTKDGRPVMSFTDGLTPQSAVRHSLNIYSTDFLSNFKCEVFTESGEWTVPADIERVKVICVGGGGGGGSYYFDCDDYYYYISNGGGGGSGYWTIKQLTVVPGSKHTIIIGAGGAGNSNGALGENGGITSFDGITAQGGFGGEAGVLDQGGAGGNGESGGSGGISWRKSQITNNIVNYPCGNGGNGHVYGGGGSGNIGGNGGKYGGGGQGVDKNGENGEFARKPFTDSLFSFYPFEIDISTKLTPYSNWNDGYGGLAKTSSNCLSGGGGYAGICTGGTTTTSNTSNGNHHSAQGFYGYGNGGRGGVADVGSSRFDATNGTNGICVILY